MKLLTGNGLRFVIAGAFNTLMSIALYQVMLFVTMPSIAYAITWLAGIIFVAVAYPSVVFIDVSLSRHNSAVTVVIYICSFLLGLLVISFAEGAYPKNRLSIFAALTLTTTFNFISMRLFLRRDQCGNKSFRQK